MKKVATEAHPMRAKVGPKTRRLHGKALRKSCPRSSHGDVILGQPARDPLALIEESNRDRLESLLPIRFTRMAESSFAFFRGTAFLQAHDLQGTPSAGIVVQCCGDCHLMNFGGFATPERLLVFDINDFDETLPGPFEWDVKRLATSFVLAARWLNFSAADSRRAVRAAVDAYRTAMVRNAGMSVLERWYANETAEDLLTKSANNPKIQKLLRKGVKKAAESTAEHVFNKITRAKNGVPRIAVQPPLLFHTKNYKRVMKHDILPFFNRYRNSLPADRRALVDRYRIVDAANKVVGVGSVGTRCFVILLIDDQQVPLFLQVKEARPSVLEGRAGTSPYKHNGERIVVGQRLMQSASDIFLGWSRGLGEHDFYIRQLRDMKVSPDLTRYTPRILTALGRNCGRTLARAHAKSGDAPTMAGYLGSGTSFDEAIVAYSAAYADQVEEDYKSFRAAIRKGRFPIKTMP